MNQSEPANPRIPRAGQQPTPFHGSTIAADMSFYCDIGVPRQALRLTQRLLEKRRIFPEEFTEAVQTIGIHASKLERWKPKLEAAYNRQSSTFKRKVRSDMLSMYVSMRDWDNAMRFISIRNARSAGEILFSMEALLALDMLEDAKRLSRKCLKCLRLPATRFEQSLLLEALASYFARTREWGKAIELWCQAPLEEPFRRNALTGIVQLHLACAYESVEIGLKELAKLKQNPESHYELCLPGNELGMTNDAEKRLLKFKRGIEKLLPEEVRKEFGVGVADRTCAS